MIVTFRSNTEKVLLRIAFLEPDIFICKNEENGEFVITNSKGFVLHFGACYMNGGIPINQAQQACANPATMKEILEEFPEIANLVALAKIE